MKFVALLSGGKDSCYNIIKCLEYGHELICLANLSPPIDFDGEEMNSFMYQTAGHTAIPFMEECFGVPLIRVPILGTAVSQKLDYLNEVDSDEVEDMYLLLKEVKEKYPDIEGVSCGAIVSTYQRLRVESICQRLGFTVLSYLWQRDRVELLHEMIDAGIEAVLVKVAGAGLDPQKHLGKSLAMLEPTLMRLHSQYGLDVCGEGGEYESLVLNCSAFKRKLVLQDTNVLIDEENYTVGYLQIPSCLCVEKTPDEIEPNNHSVKQSLTSNLHTLLYTIEKNLHKKSSISATPTERNILQASSSRSHRSLQNLPKITMGSDGYGQSTLIYPLPCINTYTSNITLSINPIEEIQRQLHCIFDRLKQSFEIMHIQLADTIFVHLYIAHSSLFKAVNDAYCTYFGHYPPSRSCVCVPLPAGVYLCLDVAFLQNSHAEILLEGRSLKRSVLHVKSMSEWAPLCIGPYAQANSIHRSLVCVAGQIPLNPATMCMYESVYSDVDTALTQSLRSILTSSSSGITASVGSVAYTFFLQLTLCLRHAHRVLQAMDSCLSRALVCTVYINLPELQVQQDSSSTSSSTSSTSISVDEAAVVIFVRNMLAIMHRADVPTPAQTAESEYDEYNDEEDEEEQTRVLNVPVLVVYTSGLPREALVEAEILGFANNNIPPGQFKYLECVRCGLQQQEGESVVDGAIEQQQKRTENLTAVVDSWPVWSSALTADDPAGSDIAVAQSAAATSTSVAADYASYSSMTVLPRSLCTGFITVTQTTSTVETNTLRRYAWDVERAAEQLIYTVHCNLVQSGLDMIYLRSLRVYYAMNSVVPEDLAAALSAHTQRLLGVTKLPILLVPMLSLQLCSTVGKGLNEERMVLSAQLMGVDLGKIDTEEWIHVKE